MGEDPERRARVKFKTKLWIFITVLLILLGLAGNKTEAQTMPTYRVVHTGDSISAMAWGIPSSPVAGKQWTSGTEEWRNLEYGRNAYTVGQEGWASTASIWPLVLSRSEPGGFIIVQDNGADVSDSGWLSLMTKIRDETPHDRTLIVVLPGYRSDINPGVAEMMVHRARVMKEVFASHPSVVFIHLDNYLRRNPGNFPDGQHPNAIAANWLRDQLDSWTG